MLIYKITTLSVKTKEKFYSKIINELRLKLFIDWKIIIIFEFEFEILHSVKSHGDNP